MMVCVHSLRSTSSTQAMFAVLLTTWIDHAPNRLSLSDSAYFGSIKYSNRGNWFLIVAFSHASSLALFSMKIDGFGHRFMLSLIIIIYNRR